MFFFVSISPALSSPVNINLGHSQLLRNDDAWSMAVTLFFFFLIYGFNRSLTVLFCSISTCILLSKKCIHRYSPVQNRLQCISSRARDTGWGLWGETRKTHTKGEKKIVKVGDKKRQSMCRSKNQFDIECMISSKQE